MSAIEMEENQQWVMEVLANKGLYFEFGDIYEYINAVGEVVKTYFFADEIDLRRILNGNFQRVIE